MAGDLAISVETARRQAADQGHALTCELKVLILHGLLHLAGYDHEADNGKMARREQKLRASLRLPHGLIERTTHKSVILSDRNEAKGVEGPAFRDLAPAKKPKPRAPSFPRLHAERVGKHNPKSRKSSPSAPSKRSARP
jgi:probable rRNA maturation factor